MAIMLALTTDRMEVPLELADTGEHMIGALDETVLPPEAFDPLAGDTDFSIEFACGTESGETPCPVIDADTETDWLPDPRPPGAAPRRARIYQAVKKP